MLLKPEAKSCGEGGSGGWLVGGTATSFADLRPSVDVVSIPSSLSSIEDCFLPNLGIRTYNKK